MPFRFVHTADLHLDSPLRSLALRDPDIAGMVGSATRQAFERIVDLCLEERVDALMIAGDLYDGELRSMKTAVFFGSRMRRLADAGIRVFVVRGNHDAESVITKHLSLPDGVHIFSGRGEARPIEDHNVVVHGVSFARPQAPASLLPKFKGPVSGCVNIGLLHTSLAGAEGHDTYAPCSVADMIGHGFDHWCLGHVHKRQVHVRSPCTVVMPGMPQGRHINEAGPKSVTLATIGDDGAITVEERVTSIVQFERVSVDVAGLRDWPDVLRAVEVALGRARNAAVSDHLIARIEIAGTTPLVSRLRRDDDLLLEEARQAAASMPRTAVEKVSVVASPPIITDGATGAPVEELRALIESEVLASDEFRSEVRNIVGDLQRQIPPELRDVLSDGQDADAEVVARIVKEGGEQVLARLDDTEGET